ncbi:hypothetical protein GF337_01260 [candidate division KSB1 bacterium]|nr:hypothetical protein [candidate division KSB1 bacterium]
MWNIGGGINYNHLARISIGLNKIQPGLVTSIYDCYNILKWMGGRPFLHVPKMTPDDYIKRVKNLNSKGIGYFHVFSNFHITDVDLDDPDCNYFLQETHDAMNGVICTSPKLIKYLRDNYPLFKIMGSCTIMERRLENLKKLQELYDILIIPPSLNKSYKLIEKLDTSRIEIMVSESCYADCKVRRMHYSLINKWNISHDLKDLQNFYDFFYRNPNTCFNRNKKQKNPMALFMKKKQIRRFLDMGVNLFKLQERYDELRTIDNIIRFVIFYSDESMERKYRMLRLIPRKRLLHLLLYKKLRVPVK